MVSYAQEQLQTSQSPEWRVGPKTEPIHVKVLKPLFKELAEHIQALLQLQPSAKNFAVFIVQRVNLAVDKSFKTTLETTQALLPLLDELVEEYQNHATSRTDVSYELLKVQVLLAQLHWYIDQPEELLPAQGNQMIVKNAEVLPRLEQHLRNLTLWGQGVPKLLLLFSEIEKLAVELDGVGFGFSHALSILCPVEYNQLMSKITPTSVRKLIGGRPLSQAVSDHHQTLQEVATVAASFHPATSPLSRPVNWWPEIW